MLRNSLRQFVTRAFKLIACFGETDLVPGIGEDPRNNRLQLFINQLVQAQPARERQVKMVLQTAPKVCQLNGIDRSGDTSILFGMQFFFPWVHQYAVAIDVALIINGFVGLSPIVESDWVGPNILPALARLLSIVFPMYPVPVEIIVYAMFEAGPDSGTRVGRRRVDHDGAGRGASPVVDPILV